VGGHPHPCCRCFCPWDRPARWVHQGRCRRQVAGETLPSCDAFVLRRTAYRGAAGLVERAVVCAHHRATLLLLFKGFFVDNDDVANAEVGWVPSDGECNSSSIGPDSSLLKNRGIFLTDKNN